MPELAVGSLLGVVEAASLPSRVPHLWQGCPAAYRELGASLSAEFLHAALEVRLDSTA